MSILITRADGTTAPFNADKINRSIERACEGLTDPIAMVTQIATETRLTLYSGITTDEMDRATINAAVQNIKEDIEYDKVATRLFLKTVYRHVIGEYDKEDTTDLKQKHRDGFITYLKNGVAQNRLHPDMLAKFDIEALADTLDIDRDELFVYAGLDGLVNRYFLKDTAQKPLETPQYFFMRVAMGLSYNEKDPTAVAKRFYKKMSKHEYLAGGSTNLGAGTTRPSLSNCFLLEIHDDMAHIAKSVSDVLLLSKDSGGIGASITKLRATGSPLKSNFGGTSSGPTPFAKIIDTAIRAVMRGGKKKGALCFYMENWHLDFPEFLDWKHNSGDDYLRMRTANTAVFLSDEFMKRVKEGKDWYMFDPADTADLNELYGKAFSKRYAEYIEMAEKGLIKAFKKVPAAEQYQQILVSLQSTSHPWLIWKDTINNRALNNNTGTIHMSNLCTEICLPQDKDHIAVCNLASINLASHISNKEVQWAKLEDTVRTVVRHLDNLVDINVLRIPEASRSDQENRAVGLGVMGFADTLERLGMAYDTEHAWDFADRIFEFISYMAIDESANLAKERGAYSNFMGSEWSKGRLPIDTIKKVEDERGVPVSVVRDSKHRGLNWDILRAKVAQGMRNATLMAVAPNANIGLVAGTTPGIDPRFAQVFSRNKISGKYLDLNHNLVKDLKNMGIWDKVKESIIERQGDIADIKEIPQYIRDIYKTSFTTSPYAFIEVAARAQKWVDQALSRNMYLETRDIDDLMKVYFTAWEKGLKSTYYLHMKPRHTAEQSTVRVNKAEQIGKKGFAAVARSGFGASAPAAPVQSTLSAPVTVKEFTEEFATEMAKEKAKEREEEQEPIPAPVVIATQAFASVAKQAVVQQAVVEDEVLVDVASEQSAPTPPKKNGYVSLADLAGSVSASVSAPSQFQSPSQSPADAVGTVKKKPKVCPTDPALLAQCDSCQ